MSKTALDYVHNFYANYIALSKKDAKISNKECRLADPADGEAVNSGWGSDKLSLVECERVIEQCPLLVKGVRKKSRDATRSWCYLKDWNTANKANNSVEKILWEFEQRSNFKYKFTKAVENAKYYGNGYIILSFLGDKNKISSPPTKGSKPWNARLLDSKKIKKLDYHNTYWKNRHVMHFHYEDMQENKDEWIHPDRIVHVPGYTFSNKKLGLSVVNLLRNTIRSKINVDIATGEILAWFAHGVFDVGIPGLQENDEALKKWESILRNHPGGLIHDTQEEVKSIDPKAINPKAFYDWIVLNIAAGLVMPTHVLTGIQTGRVTGSEIGFGDYYKDIKDEQDLKYTPIVENVYKKLLQSNNKSWKYSLVWNPIYIDETAETEIMKGRSQSIKDLTDSDVISIKEKREIYNKGQIELDVDAYEGSSEDQGKQGTDKKEPEDD